MGSRICFYWKHEVSTWPQMTEKVPHFDFQASWITIFFNLFIKLLITFLHKNLNPKFHWFWLIDLATILFTFYQSNGENSEFEIRNCFFLWKDVMKLTCICTWNDDFWFFPSIPWLLCVDQRQLLLNHKGQIMWK